jgi:hypothetical protein
MILKVISIEDFWSKVKDAYDACKKFGQEEFLDCNIFDITINLRYNSKNPQIVLAYNNIITYYTPRSWNSVRKFISDRVKLVTSFEQVFLLEEK